MSTSDPEMEPSSWSVNPIQRAFPGRTVVKVNGEERIAHNQGMTLRQWYAGQALKGILSDPKEMQSCRDAADMEPQTFWWDEVASTAFLLADAMLRREKREEAEKAEAEKESSS